MGRRMKQKLQPHHHPHPDRKHLAPPSDAQTSSWLCVRKRKKSPEYEVDVYHPIQTISRSTDGRFILEKTPQDWVTTIPNGSLKHSQYVPNGHVQPIDASDDEYPTIKSTSSSRKTPMDKTNSVYNQKFSNPPQEYRTNHREFNNKRDLIQRDYNDQRLPVQKDYLSASDIHYTPVSKGRVNHGIMSPRSAKSSTSQSNHNHTPLGAGWYEDSYFQQGKSPYKFGAWKDSHSLQRTPTSVRDGVVLVPHATPSNQTYLTSSPDQNASNNTPLIISDVSSVNPSFSTNGEHSRSAHGNIIISDSSSPHISDYYSQEGYRTSYPLPDDYYQQVRNLAGMYGHEQNSPGSIALYDIAADQDSSPRELTYTRDDLERAIQRVRVGHTPQGSMDSYENTPNSYAPNYQQPRRLENQFAERRYIGDGRQDDDDRQFENRHHKLQPSNNKGFAPEIRTRTPTENHVINGSTSSSGVGSGVVMFPRTLLAPKPPSSPNSSGIGSRENSHSTGSASQPAADVWDPEHNTHIVPSTNFASSNRSDIMRTKKSQEWYIHDQKDRTSDNFLWHTRETNSIPQSYINSKGDDLKAKTGGGSRWYKEQNQDDSSDEVFKQPTYPSHNEGRQTMLDRVHSGTVMLNHNNTHSYRGGGKDGSDNQGRCQRLRAEYLAFQQLNTLSGDYVNSQGSYVQEIESEPL